MNVSKNGNLVIGVTGSSNAGKTTFMNELKQRLGSRCVIISERIREMPTFKDRTIDEIRQNADLYCQLQFDTLTAKLNDEKEAVEKYRDTVIITDRTVVDQLMYLSCYVDKTRLSDEMMKKYSEFFAWWYGQCNNQLQLFYDVILFFRPIPPSESDLDKFRTSRLSHLQNFESKMIMTLTTGLLQPLRMNGSVASFLYASDLRLSAMDDWKVEFLRIAAAADKNALKYL